MESELVEVEDETFFAFIFFIWSNVRGNAQLWQSNLTHSVFDTTAFFMFFFSNCSQLCSVEPIPCGPALCCSASGMGEVSWENSSLVLLLYSGGWVGDLGHCPTILHCSQKRKAVIEYSEHQDWCYGNEHRQTYRSITLWWAFFLTPPGSFGQGP